MNYKPGAFPLHLNAGMAIPIYTDPSRQDVDVTGLMLLHNFIHEQFVLEELPEEELVQVENIAEEFGQLEHMFHHQERGLVDNTPEGYTPGNMVELGRNLQELANMFADSEVRSLIRERVNQVNLSLLGRNEYFELLNDVIRHGINRYGIVELFFYCSDVIIRCVREEPREVGSRLFTWAMEFLVEQVCSWVFTQGGWERVLSDLYKIIHRISVILAMAVIVSCAFVWLRKNF